MSDREKRAEARAAREVAAKNDAIKAEAAVDRQRSKKPWSRNSDSDVAVGVKRAISAAHDQFTKWTDSLHELNSESITAPKIDKLHNVAIQHGPLLNPKHNSTNSVEEHVRGLLDSDWVEPLQNITLEETLSILETIIPVYGEYVDNFSELLEATIKKLGEEKVDNGRWRENENELRITISEIYDEKVTLESQLAELNSSFNQGLGQYEELKANFDELRGDYTTLQAAEHQAEEARQAAQTKITSLEQELAKVETADDECKTKIEALELELAEAETARLAADDECKKQIASLRKDLEEANDRSQKRESDATEVIRKELKACTIEKDILKAEIKEFEKFLKYLTGDLILPQRDEMEKHFTSSTIINAGRTFHSQITAIGILLLNLRMRPDVVPWPDSPENEVVPAPVRVETNYSQDELISPPRVLSGAVTELERLVRINQVLSVPIGNSVDMRRDLENSNELTNFELMLYSIPNRLHLVASNLHNLPALQDVEEQLVVFDPPMPTLSDEIDYFERVVELAMMVIQPHDPPALDPIIRTQLEETIRRLAESYTDRLRGINNVAFDYRQMNAGFQNMGNQLPQNATLMAKFELAAEFLERAQLNAQNFISNVEQNYPLAFPNLELPPPPNQPNPLAVQNQDPPVQPLNSECIVDYVDDDGVIERAKNSYDVANIQPVIVGPWSNGEAANVNAEFYTADSVPKIPFDDTKLAQNYTLLQEQNETLRREIGQLRGSLVTQLNNYRPLQTVIAFQTWEVKLQEFIMPIHTPIEANELSRLLTKTRKLLSELLVTYFKSVQINDELYTRVVKGQGQYQTINETIAALKPEVTKISTIFDNSATIQDAQEVTSILFAKVVKLTMEKEYANRRLTALGNFTHFLGRNGISQNILEMWRQFTSETELPNSSIILKAIDEMLRAARFPLPAAGATDAQAILASPFVSGSRIQFPPNQELINIKLNGGTLTILDVFGLMLEAMSKKNAPLKELFTIEDDSSIEIHNARQFVTDFIPNFLQYAVDVGMSLATIPDQAPIFPEFLKQYNKYVNQRLGTGNYVNLIVWVTKAIEGLEPQLNPDGLPLEFFTADFQQEEQRLQAVFQATLQQGNNALQSKQYYDAEVQKERNLLEEVQRAGTDAGRATVDARNELLQIQLRNAGETSELRTNQAIVAAEKIINLREKEISSREKDVAVKLAQNTGLLERIGKEQKSQETISALTVEKTKAEADLLIEKEKLEKKETENKRYKEAISMLQNSNETRRATRPMLPEVAKFEIPNELVAFAAELVAEMRAWKREMRYDMLEFQNRVFDVLINHKGELEFFNKLSSTAMLLMDRVDALHAEVKLNPLPLLKIEDDDVYDESDECVKPSNWNVINPPETDIHATRGVLYCFYSSDREARLEEMFRDGNIVEVRGGVYTRQHVHFVTCKKHFNELRMFSKFSIMRYEFNPDGNGLYHIDVGYGM